MTTLTPEQRAEVLVALNKVGRPLPPTATDDEILEAGNAAVEALTPAFAQLWDTIQNAFTPYLAIFGAFYEKHQVEIDAALAYNAARNQVSDE